MNNKTLEILAGCGVMILTVSLVVIMFYGATSWSATLKAGIVQNKRNALKLRTLACALSFRIAAQLWPLTLTIQNQGNIWIQFTIATRNWKNANNITLAFYSPPIVAGFLGSTVPHGLRIDWSILLWSDYLPPQKCEERAKRGRLKR